MIRQRQGNVFGKADAVLSPWNVYWINTIWKLIAQLYTHTSLSQIRASGICRLLIKTNTSHFSVSCLRSTELPHVEAFSEITVKFAQVPKTGPITHIPPMAGGKQHPPGYTSSLFKNEKSLVFLEGAVMNPKALKLVGFCLFSARILHSDLSLI